MNKRDRDKTSAARMVREQLAAEKRRKRMIWTTVFVVFGVAIVGMVAWMLLLSHEASEVHTPANANAEGNAIVTGSGPVVVEDYIDFICPHCKTFHDETNAAIKQLVAENKITLVQHPVAYLDRFSSNKYSTRASAASACAADGGKFNEYVDVLFANQPAEGGDGPTDAQLIEFGKGIGLGDDFEACVKSKRYVSWAGKVSDDATKAGVTGTPTVFVNGKKIQGGSAAILAAVAAASGGPVPTPSAS
ncbi:membrane protein [Rhizocola hellebori]|uniref:Membrane protein n=1 Tax=Rhizocola hellebori TaxID=1392758 RepID=A0A8J3QAL0_9ACTN|nr:thioredoxin domain-containing protein [Rhizocola hellebori]GIH06991.1 membrane protein [Rhizocola hellebori]